MTLAFWKFVFCFLIKDTRKKFNDSEKGAIKRKLKGQQQQQQQQGRQTHTCNHTTNTPNNIVGLIEIGTGSVIGR
jgi:hypothetical protein